MRVILLPFFLLLHKSDSKEIDRILDSYKSYFQIRTRYRTL
ncbi:hypothetical protein LEP1GSC163_0273 [Leptospira santarosai str. CBC379]|uniref:Uncharacterized protein n=1 Tax=Leptospira alexanderi serovar Manhao 3 str. L 60 TaxID=1049759 RepID=V6IF31_9LEPT|nr:hypothetical protein LEP1GSC163_0273 [Leptospira santarosai str. CBC379]EQA63118.1 hypothetical protein LEP1GSC062_3613 [Leptospira alexanderi serovar Manhao 3 str. L 60]